MPLSVLCPGYLSCLTLSRPVVSELHSPDRSSSRAFCSSRFPTPDSFPSLLPQTLAAQETKLKIAEMKGYGSGLRLNPKSQGCYRDMPSLHLSLSVSVLLCFVWVSFSGGLSPHGGKVPGSPQAHTDLSALISGDSMHLVPVKGQGVNSHGPPGHVRSGDGVH